jgi:hypothetical protein
VANLDSKGLQKIKNKYSVLAQGWQHSSVVKAAMDLFLTVEQATCVKIKCVKQGNVIRRYLNIAPFHLFTSNANS